MFGIFKKKSKKEQLQKKYDQLMKEYYDLSKTDRRASDAKYAAAEAVMKELVAITHMTQQ